MHFCAPGGEQLRAHDLAHFQVPLRLLDPPTEARLLPLQHSNRRLIGMPWRTTPRYAMPKRQRALQALLTRRNDGQTFSNSAPA